MDGQYEQIAVVKCKDMFLAFQLKCKEINEFMKNLCELIRCFWELLIFN